MENELDTYCLLNEEEKLKLETFKAYSELFSLIPLKHNSKIPDLKEWSKYCTEKNSYNQKDFIHETGPEIQTKNAGICTGPSSNLIVLDVDDSEKFNKFIINNNINKLPETFSVKTSRGYHYYFSYPNDNEYDYCNKSLKDYGFDIRGLGGQVVAPGSILENGTVYKPLNSNQVQPPPDWILDYCKKPKFRAIDLDNLDISKNIIDLIKNGKPKGKRSEAVIKVLIHLMSKSIKISQIIEIFERFAIGEKYRQKNDKKESYLNHEIKKAEEYIAKHNEDYNEDKIKNFIKSYYDDISIITFNDIEKTDNNLEFLIEEVWPKNDSLLIVGSKGSCKSILAMNIACSMVSSKSSFLFNKFKITESKPNILFLQAENTLAGSKERVFNINNFYNLSEEEKNKIMMFSTNNDIRVLGELKNKQFYDTLAKNIERAEADILVIDPLISYHVESENDNSIMRSVLEKVTQLSIDYKLSVLVVHHEGKGKSSSDSSGRGASAIGDWASYAVQISCPKIGSNKRSLVCTKARYSNPFDTINLIFENHVLKPDNARNDDPILSLMIELIYNYKVKNNKDINQTQLIKEFAAEYKNRCNATMNNSKIRDYIIKYSLKNMIRSFHKSNSVCYSVK